MPKRAVCFDRGSKRLYSFDRRKFGAAMTNSAVEKIEDAIGRLTPGELSDLYAWLEEHHPQPIDDRLALDLAGGGLDSAIFRALEDESRGHTRPL